MNVLQLCWRPLSLSILQLDAKKGASVPAQISGCNVHSVHAARLPVVNRSGINKVERINAAARAFTDVLELSSLVELEDAAG